MRLSHHAPSGKTCNASVNHELFVDEYLRREGAFARLTVWWRCIAVAICLKLFQYMSMRDASR